jgi:hypothetical protein
MESQASRGRERWALTIVTTVPIPALVCGWLLLSLTPNPEIWPRNAVIEAADDVPG